MSVAAKIKARRVALGLDLKTVAATLGMTEASYWDMEGHDDEFFEVADLGQALKLAHLLDVRLLTLLGENVDTAPRGRISLQELRDLILAQIASGCVKKDELSWQIDDFLEQPTIGLKYPIVFLMDLGSDVGFDWRDVIASCEVT